MADKFSDISHKLHDSVVLPQSKKERHAKACLSFLVGVAGLEPAASWSRTKRATNCATPRQPFHYRRYRARCQGKFPTSPWFFGVYRRTGGHTLCRKGGAASCPSVPHPRPPAVRPTVHASALPHSAAAARPLRRAAPHRSLRFRSPSRHRISAACSSCCSAVWCWWWPLPSSS